MTTASEMKENNRPRRCRAQFGVPVLYEAFGVRFTVRVTPKLMDRLRGVLPVGSIQLTGEEKTSDMRFSVRRRPDGHHWRLLRGKRVVIETISSVQVLSALRSQLVDHVGRSVKNRIFVHAGAVAWKGRAILLPGYSYAGKSTLVAALLKAGATYYSDDIAVVDDEGRLHPYARDLQLRNEYTSMQQSKTVAQIAGKNALIGSTSVAVGLVVFATHVKDDPWNTKTLTPGMAAMLGMRHTLTVRDDPARTMQTWAKVMQSALAWTWERGEAKMAANKLLHALETMTMPA